MCDSKISILQEQYYADDNFSAHGQHLVQDLNSDKYISEEDKAQDDRSYAPTLVSTNSRTSNVI